jgi:hypothetical protein
MVKTKTTVYMDRELLRAVKVFAARRGKKEYEVFDDALRRYLGLELLDRVAARSDLGEKEALQLAYEELHASRK